MPRKSPPSYRLHKDSGQAVVTLGGQDRYLGRYDSPESHQRYHAVLAEWYAGGGVLKPTASPTLTVAEVVLAYSQFAETYYRKNDKPTAQVERIRYALGHVLRLYGRSPAEKFGPIALKAVRQSMLDAGWSRGYLNSCVGCVKRLWKWAASEEMVPAAVYHGVQSVAGLRKGRTTAREPAPIRPVEESDVAATLAKLHPIVADMVRVQELGGMRPCEVCAMRPCDLDTSREVWAYRPESHKTEHHGRGRVILLGPAAQAVLHPYLDRESAAHCFSPREAVESALRTAGRRVRHAKTRTPGTRYVTTSYEHAIAAACKRAGVPRWAPNQLRHKRATVIRALFGLDTARAVLGHSSAAITEVYAERDASAAAEVARKIG